MQTLQAAPVVTSLASVSRTPSEMRLDDLADRYGELHRQMKAFKPVADEYEAIGKELRRRANEAAPANQRMSVSGKVWRIFISERARERQIKSMGAIIKAFGGMKKLLDSLKVPVSLVEEKLGKEAAREYFIELQTGTRRIEPVLLEAISLDKAA